MKSILTATARLAGETMLHNWGKIRRKDVERKTGEKDIVTFVDREVEKIVFDRLNSEFPDHGFWGEESGRSNEESEATFVVDPIDGSVNYAHGLPHFAVSIARREGDRTTHGLIYLPVFDEMFWAEAGLGATMNGERLKVKKNTRMAEAIVATGFACVRAGAKPDNVPIFKKMIYEVRDLRRLGAATVDLAYVARGTFDGFYESSLSPWDVLAGALIVEESGGTVSGFKEGDDPLFGRDILASNGHLHEKLRKIIKEALGL